MSERLINFGEQAPLPDDLVPVPDLSPERYARREGVPGVIVEHTRAMPLKDSVGGYIQCAKVYQGHLRRLDEQYNIPSVNPRYVVGRYGEGDTAAVCLYVVEDHIGDAVGFSQLIEEPEQMEASLRADAIREYDGLACKFIDSIQDAFHTGGYHDYEVSSLTQSVYSPSASEGRKAILADIEPLAMYRFFHPRELARKPELQKDNVVNLTNEYAYLFMDILELQAVSDVTLSSRQKALEALQTLPSSVGFDPKTDEYDVDEALLRMATCIRDNNLAGMRQLHQDIRYPEGPDS